ncbi:MAG: acyltransferase [Sphingobium sp.]|nr:acyltransferase [Sphingobium sp.]
MKYRSDIDGLRSIAVIPIVLFHAGISAMSGGFIGVDIFFVISGYLITSIIVREMNEDRFSIVEFYRRRVVRIFPALIFMLLAVLLAGTFIMLPQELSGLGHSAIAAMLFAANIYFWFTADYFDSSAETKPLLHTWSLGVEEQFYLLFPLLLLLVIRYAPSRMRTILAAMTFISFLIGGYATLKHPQAAFYLIPARAWELGIGAMIAVGCYPSLRSEKVRNGIAIFAILLILFGLFWITPSSLFPAPWAVIPCMGAAVLIIYGENTLIGNILSTSPVRWIGKISYSLYLWHWPIITFYRLRTGVDLQMGETILLLALSFVAAALSYYFVEQPVMARLRSSKKSGPILIGGFAGLGAVVLAGIFVVVNAKSFNQLSPVAAKVASYSDYRSLPDYKVQFRRGPCFAGQNDAAQFDPALCLKTSPDRRNILVVGDSHAAQYWRAISLRYPNDNVMQATASGCRPTIDADGAERCTDVMDYVFEKYVPTGVVDEIVIAGRWKEKDVDKLVKTVRYLDKYHVDVTVIGPTVEYQGETPLLLARSLADGNPDEMPDYIDPTRLTLDHLIKDKMRHEDLTYVSAYDLICPNNGCTLFAPDGGPMQFDYGHLTLSASRWVVKQMPKL